MARRGADECGRVTAEFDARGDCEQGKCFESGKYGRGRGWITSGAEGRHTFVILHYRWYGKVFLWLNAFVHSFWFHVFVSSDK